MGIEIELKLRVVSHEPVRRRLRELGATLQRKVVETNRIFDQPNGELRRRGCGLRVRTVLDEHGQSLPAKLTFKGPRQSGDLKSREEIESVVLDPAAVVALLGGLGFTTSLCYEKRRESWAWRECIVELDEPVVLGLFVEIEGPSSAAIRAVQADLGLTQAETVSVSYVGMLAAHCDAQGIADRTIPFA